jgi:hypothetical protein
MGRRLTLFVVIGLVSLGCSSPTPHNAVTRTARASSPTGSAPPASPLEGEWDTGPYPAEQARAAIVAAGYSKASADEAVGGERRFECNFLFYEDGGVPFVAQGVGIPTRWVRRLPSKAITPHIN